MYRYSEQDGYLPFACQGAKVRLVRTLSDPEKNVFCEPPWRPYPHTPQGEGADSRPACGAKRIEQKLYLGTREQEPAPTLGGKAREDRRSAGHDDRVLASGRDLAGGRSRRPLLSQLSEDGFSDQSEDPADGRALGRRRVNPSPSANRWAADLTRLLDQVYADGDGRFPVNVPLIASDFSAQRYPCDAITLVKGASLGKFDGALYRAPAGKSGWGIIYNDAIASKGRINFTLGHEFGHYLLHRLAHPDGIQCGQQDMVRWDASYREIEQQANCFAAGLLMPLNDFRTQIPAKAKPTLDDLAGCGERYGVSLIAATLRWLEYAERRSVLVISRDGFVLWSRSSKSALKTGAFYRTVDRAPVEVPTASLAAMARHGNGKLVADHDEAWFGEPSMEVALVSDQYDFTISLVHLDEAVWRPWDREEEEPDTLDYISRR